MTRLTTTTYDLERRCQHWGEAGKDPHGLMQHQQCAREGVQVRLRCPAGRPDAVSAYCDEHGGEERARRAASRDWNYLAPESVGGAAAVENAGCMQLQTVHAYVVLRQVPQQQGGKWLAWRGLGSMLTPVVNPQGQRRSRGGKAKAKQKDAPVTSFPTREAALELAILESRRATTARVEEIRRARGGTLEWGTPVEPLDEPVVIVLEQGDSRSAWDIAVTLTRRSRSGVAGITGLRPSGECA